MLTRTRTATYTVCRAHDGSQHTFRLGQPMAGLDTADARWARVDDRRRDGRDQRVRFDGKSYRVEWVENRSVDNHGRGLGSERHGLAMPVPYRALRMAPKGR